MPVRPAVLPAPDQFKSASVRGSPGFFRVAQTLGGQWWLLDPHGVPFVSKGVGAVNRTGWAEGRSTKPGRYAAAVAALYGEADADVNGAPGAFVRSVSQRLRKWGVNTLGAWSGVEFHEQGIYYTEVIEFRKVGPSFHSGAALLPDVFDPAWRDAADTWARQICSPRENSRELIGYFTDHELGWAQPTPPQPEGIVPADAEKERPSLLQICLSLEPGYRAYHAAWEFVLAPRQGSLEQLSGDWGLEMPNREVIRQRTQADVPLLSPGYLRDQERFSREFARRYFSTCASVIRHYDPHHLVLGCRFREFPGAAILGECVPPQVDVVSLRPDREEWERSAQRCFGVGGTPVLLTDVTWADPAFAQTALKREKRRLTSVERMLAKGRTCLERVFAHRGTVGYEWSRWSDDEDDLPPFGSGLVHVDDREALEHTELLSDLNARAEAIRLKAR